MPQAIIRLALRALRWGSNQFMVVLAVNQAMNVVMEARNRQREFSWTTCLAMLRKKPESVAVSQEAVAASVSGNKKWTRASPAELAKRSLPGASGREPKVSLQRWKYLFCLLEVPSGTPLVIITFNMWRCHSYTGRNIRRRNLARFCRKPS